MQPPEAGSISSADPSLAREDATQAVQGRDESVLRRFSRFFRNVEEVSFELRLPGGSTTRFGHGAPAFAIAVNDDPGTEAICSGDETRIAEAYMAGHIDLEGDMLALYQLRNALRDRHPLLHFYETRLQPLLFGQVCCDKRWIAEHYDFEQDFYLLFLDQKFRAYSQAVFLSDDERLEDAMERKLSYALGSLGVQPGDRVLDVGGGWGAFTEYAGRRGIAVTSLTISAESEAFIQAIVEKQNLPCRVVREHFYEHHPAEPYDAIVNIGVTEHLPDYRRSLAHYHALLRPGGCVYLDASACREKYAFSSFISRYIYPGNPTPMCLREYIEEVERSPFELLELHNDRHSYELTARCWAERLDEAHDEIAQRWGEAHYRKFRLYLWGTAHAFASGLMSAYRLVIERPQHPADLRRWRD